VLKVLRDKKVAEEEKERNKNERAEKLAAQARSKVIAAYNEF
jgi:hypothetical protein